MTGEGPSVDWLRATAARLTRAAAQEDAGPALQQRLTAVWDQLAERLGPPSADSDVGDGRAIVLAEARALAEMEALMAAYAAAAPTDGSQTLVVLASDTAGAAHLATLDSAIVAIGPAHDVLVIPGPLPAAAAARLGWAAAASLGPSPLPHVAEFDAGEQAALVRAVALRRTYCEGTPVEAAPEPSREAALATPGTVTVGVKTFWTEGARFLTYYPEDCIELGAYTSIAVDVTVQAGGGRGHDPAFVSTFPLAYHLLDHHEREARGLPVEGVNAQAETTRVGSDVWIAAGAMINGGVTVGDGAIVAAGAVVFHDVPPYAIVAGNPARVLRYRFSQPAIEALMRIRWWEWHPELVAERAEWFRRPIAEFIAQFDPKETEALAS